MKTDALIDMLARTAGPAPSMRLAAWLAPAAFGGMLMAAVGAATAIGVVPHAFWLTTAPWMKLAYAFGLAACSAWLVARLARPVASLRGPTLGLLAVAVAMGLVGLMSWGQTATGSRLTAWLGHSAPTCPWTVLALSLPGMGFVFAGLRQMAPTRLRLAGFAGGLLAGALGAAGYALACDETSPMFVAAWYSVGILMAGGLGALLGPRFLRW